MYRVQLGYDFIKGQYNAGQDVEDLAEATARVLVWSRRHRDPGQVTDEDGNVLVWNEACGSNSCYCQTKFSEGFPAETIQRAAQIARR